MEIRDYVLKEKERLEKEIEKAERPPFLVIVKMNDDPASAAYVKGKVKDCYEVGIKVEVIDVPLDESEEKLLELLGRLNNDSNVDGYIVQMPLPKHISETKIQLAIAPHKDVDGFHPMSSFKPCTPKGVIDYLKSENISFNGKNAVVIGRSNIVGRPLSKMLLDLNTNCVVLHSKTTRADMEFYIEHADLIFIAIGQKGFLDKSFTYRPTAVIVDIGISRVDGHLYGDAESDLPVYLKTPVPGGVGLLTRLTLLKNVWEAYKNEL